MTDDALVASGIGPGTIRLSIGLEDPADLIDDLKKEFPDMEMPELVKLADERVSAEIARRKALEEAELKAQNTIAEGDETAEAEA